MYVLALVLNYAERCYWSSAIGSYLLIMGSALSEDLPKSDSALSLVLLLQATQLDSSYSS